MSETAPPVGNAGTKAATDTAKVLDNPALRMLGLPRLRAKLPSRNWLIFWSILGGFGGTVWYDRRQKSFVQQKWCNAVSHLSAESLATTSLPRTLTIYLSAPPGDNLRQAREHFQEYVKPILVAAGIDWTAVEGRKEGDIRAALAENIRKRRRKEAGEASEGDTSDVTEVRIQIGVQDGDSRGGDLIIGRHTWKEYVRGLHEGWLGPLHPPRIVEETTQAETVPAEGSESSPKPEPEEKKPQVKPSPPPPYIRPADYAQSTSSVSQELPVSIALANPHLLGFLKTPIRIWRFLNRRELAESQGREVVNLLLADANQAYEKHDEWEQKMLLEEEEQYWHKSARAPNPEDQPDKERPWTEDMVMDDRIGSRMRKPGAMVVDDAQKGHLIAWKGGADPVEPIGWWKWLKWAFDVDYPEPTCKGWEDGLKESDHE